MIFEAIVSALAAVVRALVGLFGSLPAPSWLTDADGLWAQFVATLSGVGVWVPWGTAGTVVAAVLSCVAIGFTIKVVRLVASYLTGGGGSAA